MNRQEHSRSSLRTYEDLGGLHRERFAKLASVVTGSVKRRKPAGPGAGHQQRPGLTVLGAGGRGGCVCCFFSLGPLSL